MTTLDPRHLPKDRLASTDQDGSRIWIIPTQVRGPWKNRKTIFHIFLLLIFVLTPWLRFNGQPLFLFDILHRQFIFFGHVFGAHDAPLLFFVLGILGFSLIVATALWGRVWCGWACPQTVFIEQVFRRIESWVIGQRSEQLNCYKNPLQMKNFIKITIKWVLFVLISLGLSHTFIAYFVSWEKLLEMMSQPPRESWTVFLFVFTLAGLILFDFAWFREQFCIIMCPYGRFQSVLMDTKSLTVTYDYNRGEPRGHKTSDLSLKKGDCVDCYKCVSVCPTGIDIRDGLQLECIACTACIDACDEVMEKIDRPKGLIRYASQNDLDQGVQKQKFRPRLVFYFIILISMVLGLAYTVFNHQSFYYSILRQGQRPYVVSSNVLLNNYRIHLKNPSLKKMDYEVSLKTSAVKMSPPMIQGTLLPNESVHRPFFIQIEDFENKALPQIEVFFRFGQNGSWKTESQKIQLVGPRGDSEK